MRATDARVFLKLPFDVFNINLYEGRSPCNLVEGQTVRSVIERTVGHQISCNSSSFLGNALKKPKRTYITDRLKCENNEIRQGPLYCIRVKR